MEKHVTNICRSTYIEIWRISNIRHHLTIDATKPLLCAFVLSKLDCCNSLLKFCEVLQNIFLTNSKRSKILQPDLSSKLASMNTSNLFFRNFTGYQLSQESSIKSQLCATILSLKVTQSIFLDSWLSAIHPDNFAPFLTLEPSAYLSQKQRPLDNKLFLSQARHSGTRYHIYDVHHSVSTSSFKQALKIHLIKSACNWYTPLHPTCVCVCVCVYVHVC